MVGGRNYYKIPSCEVPSGKGCAFYAHFHVYMYSLLIMVPIGSVSVPRLKNLREDSARPSFLGVPGWVEAEIKLAE